MGYTLWMPSPDPLPDLPPERIAGLAQAYLTADYRWELDGDWHDLRIGLQAPGLELAHPHASCFGMLSAWNPWSMERPELENRAADQELHEALAATGCGLRPAFASAPNRLWREPSWAVVGMPVEAFDALARRFRQLGTLWWRTGEAVRMRMDAAAPAGFDREAPIDWLR